jgi:hypothetical protein
MLAVVLALLAVAAPKASYNSLQIAPNLPAADGERSATLISYYFGADVATGSAGLRRVEALQEGKFGPASAHSLLFLKTTDTAPTLYLIGDKLHPKIHESPVAPGLQVAQSNNPLFFEKVLGWGYAHYPGQRRYLQILAHGNAVHGLGTDQTQTDPAGEEVKTPMGSMPIQGFAKALRNASPGHPIDVVLFISCMMGNVEAMYEMDGAVRYAIASQQVIKSRATVVDVLPAAFDRLIRLQKPPELIARSLASQAMPAKVKKRVLYGDPTVGDQLPDKAEQSGFESVSAIDIAQLKPLAQATAVLVKALKKKLNVGDEDAAVAAAYDQTPKVSREGYGDLSTFAGELAARVKDPAVRTAAKAVQEAMQKALLFHKDVTGEQHGLSVYMPRRNKLEEKKFIKHGYAQTRFARETGWDKLLRGFMPDEKDNPRTPRQAPAPKGKGSKTKSKISQAS